MPVKADGQNPESMRFHLIKAAGRPLFAVPCGSARLRDDAAMCFPVHTWKKRVVRDAVRLASRTGLIRRLFPATETPLPGMPEGALENWLSDMRALLADPDLQPMLVWPGDPARGRIYLNLLGSDGRARTFCKLSLDARNDALIRHEGETLAELAMLDLKLSRIPEVIAKGLLGGHTYLVVSCSPRDARASDWERDKPINDAIGEFAGVTRTISAAEASALSWWPRIVDCHRSHPCFFEEVSKAVQSGVEVCRIHGDLNQTNVLRDGNDIWLLDWEQSHADGPALTDPVCVAVDRLFRMHPKNAAGNLQMFRNQFLKDRDHAARHQAILALAYLGAVRFTPALAIIGAWQQD